jgi:hypothetical protein
MTSWTERPEALKQKMKDSVKRFRHNRKLTLLEYKGGMVCTQCGYNKAIPEVYEFHHSDPTQKDPSWGKMISNNHRIGKMKKEIDKCVVLCANCHRETHYKLKSA